MIDFEADANSAEPTEGELSKIRALAARMQHAQQVVAQREAELKEAKAALRQIQEIDLPEAMAEVGMTDFTLDSGEKVRIKDVISASIPEANAQAAFDWLEEHNLGDLIKHNFVVPLGRGERERALELLQFLNERGIACTNKASVHPQTLSATVREQKAKGVIFPEDIFKIYEGKKAEIKMK